jgi:hypothetical protein
MSVNNVAFSPKKDYSVESVKSKLASLDEQPVSLVPPATKKETPAEPVKSSLARLDEGTISFEEAKMRKEMRDLEEAKLMCSIENKEACKLNTSYWLTK